MAHQAGAESRKVVRHARAPWGLAARNAETARLPEAPITECRRPAINAMDARFAPRFRLAPSVILLTQRQSLKPDLCAFPAAPRHLHCCAPTMPHYPDRPGRVAAEKIDAAAVEIALSERPPSSQATDRPLSRDSTRLDAGAGAPAANLSRLNIHKSRGAAINTVLYVPEMTPITSEKAKA